MYISRKLQIFRRLENILNKKAGPTLKHAWYLFCSCVRDRHSYIYFDSPKRRLFICNATHFAHEYRDGVAALPYPMSLLRTESNNHHEFISNICTIRPNGIHISIHSDAHAHVISFIKQQNIHDRHF